MTYEFQYFFRFYCELQDLIRLIDKNLCFTHGKKCLEIVANFSASKLQTCRNEKDIYFSFETDKHWPRSRRFKYTVEDGPKMNFF